MSPNKAAAPQVGPGLETGNAGPLRTDVGVNGGPVTGGSAPAHPVWFGPGERSLFGLFHEPAGRRARYGVVLCLPVGDEERRVYLAFRKLAESLAGAGHAVLRFSYDGTGDSVGSFEDPDRIESWTRSIAHAVEVVRASGVAQVAVIGMRLGATLATRAAQAMDRPLDALVLWDPCVTGREFLRHQQVLLTTTPGPPSAPGPGVETPGYSFSAELAADLRRLSLTPVSDPRRAPWFWPDRTAPPRTGSIGLWDRPPSRNWTPWAKASSWTYPRSSAVIPWRSIHQITTWLTDGAPPPVQISSPTRDEASVGTDLPRQADP